MEGTYQSLPILFSYSEGAGGVFDPLPFFEQDLATFLLIRGAYAYIGYNWVGCSFDSWPSGGRHNQSFQFPDALNKDYGTPKGVCSEIALGVFAREFEGGATVQFDCNTWQGKT